MNRNPLLFSLCLAILIAAGFLSPLEAAKFNRVVEIGQQAPDFRDLPGTDGKAHSLNDHKQAKLLVIAFTCNHCPVAKMYEQRFLDLSKNYKEQGVDFIAVSCSLFPADGFEQMQKRAEEQNYTYPYLHDADQSTGRSYGATSTPQIFVLDAERKIAYMGAFDDNMHLSKVKRHYVIDAVDSLLAGEQPEVTESRPRGCGIEYAALNLKPKKKTKAITLKVVDKAGYEAVLKKHKGKVVVVDFWATWCIPCLKGMPHMIELQEKLGKRGLVVISMCMMEPEEETKDEALEVLTDLKAHIPNLMCQLGGEEEAFEAFDIKAGLPHYKIYDRRGKLVRVFENDDPNNPFDHTDVEAAVKKILER